MSQYSLVNILEPRPIQGARNIYRTKERVQRVRHPHLLHIYGGSEMDRQKCKRVAVNGGVN